MDSTLDTINTIAGWIPSKVRGVIYALIGLFWLIEAIWNVIPDNDFGSKVAATITVLGLIMAVGNTDLVPEPAPAMADGPRVRDAGESALVTILIVVAIVVLVLFIIGYVRP